MRSILTWFLSLAIVGLIVAVWLVWPNSMTQDELSASLPAGFAADAGKGETLYYTAGCGNCHMDDSSGALIGGKGLETPFFGTFHPSNITPDAETGIGGWSELQFINAVKRGVRPDNAPYYPALPYSNYAKATNEDLLHIKAYLDQLEPVSHQAPDNALSFPANIRWGVGAYKKLLVSFDEFEPDPTKSDAWNRGAYLTEALAHCGMCHTPRTPWQTEDRSKAFQGAPALKAGERAAKGIAGWSVDDITFSLNADAVDIYGLVSSSSSMAHVSYAFDNVPYEDQEAIAEYINSFPKAAP